jgi:hypothetical protein
MVQLRSGFLLILWQPSFITMPSFSMGTGDILALPTPDKEPEAVPTDGTPQGAPQDILLQLRQEWYYVGVTVSDFYRPSGLG